MCCCLCTVRTGSLFFAAVGLTLAGASVVCCTAVLVLYGTGRFRAAQAFPFWEIVAGLIGSVIVLIISGLVIKCK